MCGIAGWYRRGGRPVLDGQVISQCDAIRHRGPDDSGVFVDGDFGFGMRRLSIVDVAGGHQPMCSPDGRFAIIFNGEIYNHLEIREEIGSRYDFRTHCDTETVLAAFSLWQNEAWRRLEGMFAIAVFDREQRVLTLARDPIGIKPLYYSEQRGGLAFASELKAIRVLPDHEFTIDDQALADYFRFGHVRRPRSIFQQVRTLDPGCYLTVSAEGESRIDRYWSARFSDRSRLSDSEWIEQMVVMFEASCKRHMMADVPVAAFLSGGIDSSSVLAAMAAANRSPIQAFTISHPGHSIDESAAASLVARHLGCDHVIAPLDPADVMASLPEIAASYDEPFADMAAIPTWFVSRLASERVKVVLCGEGGDELFSGYKRHRNADLIARHRNLVDLLRPVANGVGAMRFGSSSRLNRLAQYAGRLGEFAGAADGYAQFFLATQISSSAVHERLISPRLAGLEQTPAELEQIYFSGESGARTPLDEFVYADLTLNLPSDMLTRLDRASMAHSLEARVPFLSHKMVEWALGVPGRLKLRRGVGKYLVRQAARRWLPAEILNLPKQGFQIPMASWLRTGPFADFALDTWHDSGAQAAGYLHGDEVNKLFDEHRSGLGDHSRLLYAILIFCLWWNDDRERGSGV